MILNYIGWWGSCPGALRSMKSLLLYHFSQVHFDSEYADCIPGSLNNGQCISFSGTSYRVREIIIIWLLVRFLTPVLAGDLSLESEWQQVCSSLLVIFLKTLADFSSAVVWTAFFLA